MFVSNMDFSFNPLVFTREGDDGFGSVDFVAHVFIIGDGK
jgi:hypothetical protein